VFPVKCELDTRPLVREDAAHQQTRKCVTEMKMWLWALDGCLTPRQTARMTAGRNVASTSASTCDFRALNLSDTRTNLILELVAVYCQVTVAIRRGSDR
jgi:hypothetical protein